MKYKLFILLILPILLSSCSLIPSKKASLQINTDPQASVFLDDDKIGSTPFYEENIKEGEYTIKLIPEEGVGLPWEKRIKLLAGVKTQISRKLAENQDDSNGYDLSMEPNYTEKASIVIISQPQGSIVKIDGEAKGFTPLEIKDISEGEHTIQITSPGYIERTLRAEFFPKYKVNVSVQLAKSDKEPPVQEQVEKKNSDQTEETKEKILDDELREIKDEEATKEKSSTGKDLEPPYVTIEETSTGWLNIRQEPSTAKDNIIKKAKPGEKYTYIDKNEVGWYKIELEDGEVGWLSSKYVTLTKE